MSSFNPLHIPCVTVLVRPNADPAETAALIPHCRPGALARASLRQVLVAAHLIADLHVPHVAVEASLRRLLTALAIRVAGLDEVRQDAWEDNQERALRAGRFDPTAIDAYLAVHQHRFDLYDPQQPFLQDPRLATECTKASAPGRLAMTRASGNTQPWVNHTPESVPVESGEALGRLLAWRDYGPCGTAAQRSHAGITTKSAKSGPNRRLISYFPHADNLFTSLVLACPPPSRWPDMPGDDLAPWDQDNLPAPLAPTVASGPVSLLTARTAHAVRLTPGDDGAHSAACWIAWGTRSDLPPAIDPFTMTTPKGNARIELSPGTWTPEFHAARVILRDAAVRCSNWIGLRWSSVEWRRRRL